MIAAFVLATFGLGSVVTFALDHLLALTAAGGLGLIAAAVLLAIFLPATMPLIRTAFDVALKGLAWLIGTVAGRVIIAIIIAFLAGFWTRGAFDRTAELQRQIEAQREATAAAQAEVAQARQEAAALDQVNDAAARRAEAAEADASDYAEQAADLEDKIEAESKSATPAKPAHPCPLSAANVRDFLLIGAPRATKP